MSGIGFGSVSSDRVCRHADGSIDIAAYARKARALRGAATRAWVRDAVGGVLTLLRHSRIRRQPETRNLGICR